MLKTGSYKTILLCLGLLFVALFTTSNGKKTKDNVITKTIFTKMMEHAGLSSSSALPALMFPLYIEAQATNG